MSTKLFVGNLPYRLTSNEIEDMFSQFGAVTDVHVPVDRDTGRPRGFAFVTMATQEEAQAATKDLDGQDIDGRNIVVNEARPREERGGGGGGNGGGGGGGRRGGGGGDFRRY